LAHFSELGENARLYLLKSKSIGRFLDIFLNDFSNKQTQQISEKFRNETLAIIPLFQIEKELYLESNLEKNDVAVSMIERK
jgi:hypothetical protein